MLNTFGKTLSADKTTRIIEAAKRKAQSVVSCCTCVLYSLHPTFAFIALTGVDGLSQRPASESSAYSDHTLQRGQDCAVDYGDDGVFYRRVTEIKIPSGGMKVHCSGKVSLQNRPPGVVLRCAWYEEVDCVDLPLTSLSNVPSFALGRSNPEYCKLF